MARQEINQSQIRNNDLTGADINHVIGIFDETHSYGIGEQCFWGGRIYVAVDNVAPSKEGDLSNNPSVNTEGWELLQRSAFGSVEGVSFTGNPKKAVIEFSTPFKDADYTVQITGSAQRAWSYESKQASGFVINSNANQEFTGTVDWSAVQNGEL